MGSGTPTTSLPVSITSRLAPEFYDQFLDEFHSSRSTLASCSSVCKQWLQICRPHLFVSVNLRPDFVRFLRASPHALATIVPYIRNVGLGGGWMREQQDEFNDIILFTITLEHVRKIQMETWSWSYLAPATATTLLEGQGTIFQTLKVLDLKFIHFPSFSILRSLASQFTRLEELAFDNVTWDSPADDALDPETECKDPPPILPKFQKLAVSACSNTPVVLWLSGTEESAPLRSLHLPEILPHEVSLVGKFLSTLASSLETLELGFLTHNHEDAPAIQDAVGEIDLSLHAELRTIRLHQLSLYQFPSTPPTPGSSPLAETSSYLWLVPFLSRVGSSELTEITFNIWLGRERQLDSIDWNGLVKVLVNPLFSKLELVHFHVRGIQEGLDDQVRGWISLRLRDWEGAQECLQVSFQ